MAGFEIDWDAASVRDGTLSVPFTGEPARGWLRRFRGALAMLDLSASQWDAPAVKKGAITVAHVVEGSEEKLRHLLDSAVLEANAGLDGEVVHADRDLDDARRARDRRMTRAFQQADDKG